MSRHGKVACCWAVGLMCVAGPAAWLSAKPPQLPADLTPTAGPEGIVATPDGEFAYSPETTAPHGEGADDVPVLKKKVPAAKEGDTTSCPYLKCKPTTAPKGTECAAGSEMPDVLTNLKKLQRADRLLAKAEAHLKAGRYKEAQECHDKLVRLLPDGPPRILSAVALLENALQAQSRSRAKKSRPTAGDTEEAEDGEKAPAPGKPLPAGPGKEKPQSKLVPNGGKTPSCVCPQAVPETERGANSGDEDVPPSGCLSLQRLPAGALEFGDPAFIDSCDSFGARGREQCDFVTVEEAERILEQAERLFAEAGKHLHDGHIFEGCTFHERLRRLVSDNPTQLRFSVDLGKLLRRAAALSSHPEPMPQQRLEVVQINCHVTYMNALDFGRDWFWYIRDEATVAKARQAEDLMNEAGEHFRAGRIAEGWACHEQLAVLFGEDVLAIPASAALALQLQCRPQTTDVNNETETAEAQVRRDGNDVTLLPGVREQLVGLIKACRLADAEGRVVRAKELADEAFARSPALANADPLVSGLYNSAKVPAPTIKLQPMLPFVNDDPVTAHAIEF